MQFRLKLRGTWRESLCDRRIDRSASKHTCEAEDPSPRPLFSRASARVSAHATAETEYSKYCSRMMEIADEERDPAKSLEIDGKSAIARPLLQVRALRSGASRYARHKGATGAVVASARRERDGFSSAQRWRRSIPTRVQVGPVMIPKWRRRGRNGEIVPGRGSKPRGCTRRSRIASPR